MVISGRESDNGNPPRLGHIAALDGLRGLAVALVVGVHVWRWNNYVSHPGRLIQLLQQWTGWGWCGVNIFFVLSGFLITSILLETRDRPAWLWNFYGRRALRIFPLYFGVVLGLAALSRFWHGSDALNQFRDREWWFFTYTSNVFPFFQGNSFPQPLGRWLGHFWTLCVEEHFYLVWPFVVGAVSRAGRLLAVCAVCYLASVVCKMAFVWHGWTEAAYFTTPARIDALLLGAAAAIAWKSGLSRQAVNRAALFIFAIAALVALAGMFGSQNWSKLPGNLLWTSYGIDWLTAGLILLLVTSQANSLAICLTATPSVGAGPNVLKIPLGGAILTNPWLMRLGVISYGVYILHMPIQQFFAQNIWPRLGMLRSLPSWADFGIYAVVTTAVTLLAAELSWRFFESPFLSLKDRWFARKEEAPQPSPAIAPVLSGE